MLHYSDYGFKEEDLDKEYYVNDTISKGLTRTDKPIKLRELIDKLNSFYCGKIGY